MSETPHQKIRYMGGEAHQPLPSEIAGMENASQRQSPEFAEELGFDVWVTGAWPGRGEAAKGSSWNVPDAVVVFGAFDGDVEDGGIPALDDHFNESGWTSEGKRTRDVRHEAEMLAQEASDRMLYRAGDAKAGLVGFIDPNGGLVWASVGEKLRLYLVRGGVAMHVNEQEASPDVEQFNWFESGKRRGDPERVGYSGTLPLQMDDVLFAVAEDAADAGRLPAYVTHASAGNADSSGTIARRFIGVSGKPDRLAAVIKAHSGSDSPSPAIVPFPESKKDDTPKAGEVRPDAGPSAVGRAKLKDFLQLPLFGVLDAAAAGDTRAKADAGAEILEALASPEFRSRFTGVDMFDEAVRDYVRYWGGPRAKFRRAFRNWGSGYHTAGQWEKGGIDDALAAMVDHLIALRASSGDSDVRHTFEVPAPIPAAAEPAGQVPRPPAETPTAAQRAAGEIHPVAGASSGGEDARSEDWWNRARAWLGGYASDAAMGARMYYDDRLHKEVMKLANRDFKNGFDGRPAILEQDPAYGPAKPSLYHRLGRVAAMWWPIRMNVQDIYDGYEDESHQTHLTPAYRLGRALRRRK